MVDLIGIDETWGAVRGKLNARLAGQVNVTEMGAVGNGVANDTAAFVAAISTGFPVRIPRTETNIYIVNAAISLPALAILAFDDPSTEIRNTAANGNIFNVAGNGVAIIGGTLNGQSGLKSSGYGVYCDGFDDFSAIGVTLRDTDSHGYFFKNCDRPSVTNGAAKDCGQSGVYLENVDDWTVENNDLSGNLNFGCFAWKASRNGRFRKNWCNTSGLELFGQQFDCFNNDIAYNRAEGTGDNGISVNGYFNRVIGNKSRGNQFHGICVYGSGNVIEGNTCSNNGQAKDGATYGGICVNPFWGGLGRDNSIGPNVCFDDQSVATQNRPVLLNGNSYSLWAAGQTGITTNSLRFFGDNVYRARTAGTTGVTPPTHASGEVSDGTIIWAYCASRQRGLYDRQIAWATGQVVAIGVRRYNGSRIYQSTTTGTTGATAPTHTTTAVVSDGGVSWQLVRTVPSDFATTGNTVEGVIGFGNANDDILDNGTGNIIRARTGLAIRVPGRELVTQIYSDAIDPLGNVSAPPGSMFLRRSGDLPSKTAYLKVGSTGTDQWVEMVLRLRGTTAQRPTLASGSEGTEYFDITLGKAIWWKGAVWVDGTGATV